MPGDGQGYRVYWDIKGKQFKWDLRVFGLLGMPSLLYNKIL